MQIRKGANKESTMKTYKQMSREELVNTAKAWEVKHRCGCVVYQTQDGDAGLQWNAQQQFPANSVWHHVQGMQELYSE